MYDVEVTKFGDLAVTHNRVNIEWFESERLFKLIQPKPSAMRRDTHSLSRVLRVSCSLTWNVSRHEFSEMMGKNLLMGL